MKVLFLDMDGVILSGRELRRTKNNSYVPPSAVALLNQVVERTGCQVVMSSAWRYLKPDARGLLREAGLQRVTVSLDGLDIEIWEERDGATSSPPQPSSAPARPICAPSTPRRRPTS